MSKRDADLYELNQKVAACNELIQQYVEILEFYRGEENSIELPDDGESILAALEVQQLLKENYERKIEKVKEEIRSVREDE